MANLITMHLLYSMTSVVVLFAYPIKLNISQEGRELAKFCKRSCIVILADLPRAGTKFHNHFNNSCNCVSDLKFCAYCLIYLVVMVAYKGVKCGLLPNLTLITFLKLNRYL